MAERCDLTRIWQSQTVPRTVGAMAEMDEALLAETMRRTLRNMPMQDTRRRALYMTWCLWRTEPHTACAVLLDREYRHVTTIAIRKRNLWTRDILTVCEGEEKARYLFVGHTHTEHALVPSLEDLRTDEILRRTLPETAPTAFLDSYITDRGFDYIVVRAG